MGHWFLCERHQSVLVDMLGQAEINRENTISDVKRNHKGNIRKFVNERPMEDAK